MKASNSSSNQTNITSSFVFPNIKPDPSPVLVQGPAGELFNFTNIRYTTANSFALASAIVPPNAGPPAHIHHWTNEWLYFPEGGFVFFSSYEQYPDPSKIPNGCQLPKANMHRYYTKPGDLLYAPAYYVHGYRNEDNVSRPVITVWSPDAISQFFLQVGQILTDSSKTPPVNDINKKLFVSLAPIYGMNISSSWDEYVASWHDDLQPPIGMDANGQELLDLLNNNTAQKINYQAPALDMLISAISWNTKCQSSLSSSSSSSFSGTIISFSITIIFFCLYRYFCFSSLFQ